MKSYFLVGLGFIGSKLKKRLEHIQFNVIGIDKQEGNDLLDCDLPNEVDFVIHLAGKSGVTKNIPDNKIVAGFPAKDINLWKKEVVRNNLKK